MSLRVKNCDLLVDFQKNRLAFKVATLGTPLPDELNKVVQIKSSGAGPSQSALETFIKREYPTFFLSNYAEGVNLGLKLANAFAYLNQWGRRKRWAQS